jgi:hypothetical protein
MDLSKTEYCFYDILELSKLDRLEAYNCNLRFFIGRDFFKDLPKVLDIKVFLVHKLNIFLFCQKEEDIKIVLLANCSPHIGLYSNLRTHVSLQYIGGQDLHIPYLEIENCIIREITGIENICMAFWKITPTKDTKDVTLNVTIDKVRLKCIHVNSSSPLDSLIINASMHQSIMVTGEIKDLVLKLYHSEKIIIDNREASHSSSNKVYTNILPSVVFFRGYSAPKFYENGKEKDVITKDYIRKASSKLQLK